MNTLYYAAVSASLVLVGSGSTAAPARLLDDPLRFFEGRTEGVSTVKVVLKKPYQSRTTGRGTIRPDGSLHLIQRVEEQGKAPYERRWHIRRVAPGRFSGTMSEAKGPVTIQDIGGRYRFNIKMKGDLSVEQWLTPSPDGKSARSRLTVRKFGMTVARSEGIVRKLD